MSDSRLTTRRSARAGATPGGTCVSDRQWQLYVSVRRVRKISIQASPND